MIFTPYESTVCKGHVVNGFVDAVVDEMIDGNLSYLGNGIYEVTYVNSKVPVFDQLLCKNQFGNRRNPPEVVINARPYLKEVRGDRSGEKYYSNVAESDLQILRAKLQIIWQSDMYRRSDLLQLGDLPAEAFTHWVGHTISGRLGLDPEKTMYVSAITAYYYNCLFYTEEEFTEEIRLRAIQVASRVSHINPNTVFEIIGDLGYLANVSEFIGALHDRVDSTRIKQVSVGFLFTVLRSSWFGANGPESACVALEHPPTFIAMVSSGLELRTFKNYTLSKVVQNKTRRGNDAVFLKSLATVLNQLKD